MISKVFYLSKVKKYMNIVKVTMPVKEKNIHIVTEVLAVIVIAPLLLWIAYSGNLSPTKRYVLIAMAIVTILVDGYLLLKSGEW